MEEELFKHVGKGEWFNWYDVEMSKLSHFIVLQTFLQCYIYI